MVRLNFPKTSQNSAEEEEICKNTKLCEEKMAFAQTRLKVAEAQYKSAGCLIHPTTHGGAVGI